MNSGMIYFSRLIYHQSVMTSPLYEACKNGNADIVKFLLERGADPCEIVSEKEDCAYNIAFKKLKKSIEYIGKYLDKCCDLCKLERNIIIYRYLVSKLQKERTPDQTFLKVSKLIDEYDLDQRRLLSEIEIVKMICENTLFLENLEENSCIYVSERSIVILKLLETFCALKYTDIYQDLYWDISMNLNVDSYQNLDKDLNEFIEYFFGNFLPQRSDQENIDDLLKLFKRIQTIRDPDSREDVIVNGFAYFLEYKSEYLSQAFAMIRESQNDSCILSYIRQNTLADDELSIILEFYIPNRQCQCDIGDHSYFEECKRCREQHLCCKKCSRDDSYIQVRDTIIENLSIDCARSILETNNRLYRVKNFKVIDALFQKVFNVDRYFLSLAEMDELKIIKMIVLEGVFDSKDILDMYPTAGPQVKKFLSEYFSLFGIEV